MNSMLIGLLIMAILVKYLQKFQTTMTETALLHHMENKGCPAPEMTVIGEYKEYIKKQKVGKL